jgi:predicted N-acetyltransferase YhbS
MVAVENFALRALARDDLPAVAAIDAAQQGRSRRAYIERRLAAALREPQLHVQLGATDGAGLAGYILARVLEGEFGGTEPALRLELVGVRADARGRGIGRALFDALLAWARRHGIGAVRTAAAWRDFDMLRWLDAMGCALAAAHVIECAVDGGAYRAERDAAPPAEPPREIDFAAPESNDYERLVRDTADVRSMAAADLDAIARIDRGITGRDRRGYLAARLAEAMHDSAVRVSLVAVRDGALVGYLMARADFGDFGRTEPVAVIDTLGVDPEYARRGIGRALLSQLFANLGALRVERVETIVAHDDLALAGFFTACGFVPSQRLAFVRAVGR